MTTYVLAGTIDEAVHWALLHKLPRGQTGYLQTYHAARQVPRGTRVYLIGTWFKRPDAVAMLSELTERECSLEAVEMGTAPWA